MADHEATVRRFYDEVMTKGDLDALDELVHDDFVEHEGLPGVESSGREAPRQVVRLFREAFPDLVIHVDDVVSQGDKVAVRARMTGTHQGELMGIPPTGRPVEVSMMDLVEFEEGKAVAHWGVTDTAGMMEQLGVMEVPG